LKVLGGHLLLGNTLGHHFSVLKLGFLSLSVAYGVFSSSTPDSIGLPEILTLVSIVLISGKSGIVSLLNAKAYSRSYALKFFYMSFFYMLIVPTVYGIVFNNAGVSNFLRDIIPFFYMFLFIFCSVAASKDYSRWVSYAGNSLCFIGMAFSLRYYSLENVSIEQVGSSVMFGDMNYFPMDPAVQFGAVFGFLEGIRHLEDKKVTKTVLYFLASGACILALAGMLIRAPLILFGLVLAWRLLSFRGEGAMRLLIRLSLPGILIALIFSFIPIFELIYEKSLAVGLNTKDREALEAFSSFLSSPMSFLFGTGWGGLFQSVSVGQEVRYVHNFVMYYALKAGLVGLVFATVFVVYIYGKLLLSFLKRFLKRCPFDIHMSVYVASLLVLSSSFFLQANFKSLTFGIVIAIVVFSFLDEVKIDNVAVV